MTGGRAVISLLALLALTVHAAPSPAQNAGPQGDGKQIAPSGPAGLIGIARHESTREKLERDKLISETILQLGIYTDSSLAFVQRKKQEILAYGAKAIPHLVQAMEVNSSERTRVNAGRIAASILAQIQDPLVEKEVLRMLESSNDWARVNAVHCLGEMGLARHLDKVKANLASDNRDLLEETLICLGRLKSADTLVQVRPFFLRQDPRLHAAAIQALNLWGGGGQEACELVLGALKTTQDRDVKQQALNFIQFHGTAACVPVLFEKYSQPGVRRQERTQILTILTVLGKSLEPNSRKEVVDFLKSLLDKEDYDLVKKAAYHLNELGDDSGLEVLTAKMDRLITKHGNAEYHFYRGEIYLQFKKYKDAKRDFQEGLRKDKKAGRYGVQKAYIALARCYAAEGRFLEAERYIRKAELQDTSFLPRQYKEFQEMAQDARHAKIFQPDSK